MATIEKRDTGEGITYRVKVRIKGHPAQSATFERLTDARRWAQSTEAAIRERRYFKTSEAQRRTLAELCDRYTRDVIPQKGRWARDQAKQLAWWRAELGALSLADVTPARIAEARNKLARGVTVRGGQRSPSTVNRYLAALSHAFAIAMKEWGWLEDSPLRKVTKPKEPRGRVRYLSDDERARLLEQCRKSESPDLYHAVVLALSTGARRMEILGLRWGQVDFARRAITLLETKNGEIRSLPLVGHAFDLMQERAKVRRIDTDLVFPGRKKNRPVDLRTPFETAVKRASIENFRWHDLRHSAASYLAMNGATLAEIAEVLGHKTLAMVKRYAHLSQAHTTRVVEAMNARILADMQTFTIEQEAAVIANKYGWHEGAQKTLEKQLLDAAKDGTLTVRHPHTDLPYRPKVCRKFYERVGASDLNRYFEAAGVPWRLDNDAETSDRLFETEWWTLMQVLAWVYLGDRALVREGAMVRVREGGVFAVHLTAKAANGSGARYPSYLLAEEALLEALQTGKLTAYGLLNGESDPTEIPPLLWAGKVWWDPDHTLRFKRKDILAIWLDPFDRPDDRPSAEEHPAGIPEEPGVPPGRVGDNVFKGMDGLTWAEITITFTERDAVRIRARARSETFTFDAMGFKNRKSLMAKPNQCWETLKCLAIVSTSNKTWSDVSPDVSPATFKKQISQLRKQLQRVLEIADDPITFRRGVGYEAAFNLQTEDHAIQAVRERCAASADEDEEDDIQRVMSKEPYR